MHVLNVREALGGRWAGNVTGWLILFVPTSLLVVLQETTTGSSIGAAVTLAVISHLVAGVFLISWVVVLHRRHPVISIPLMVVAWSIVGMLRGVVSAAWHQWVLGDSPELLYRVGIWIMIGVIWSPLFTYTLAQLDHRRLLLVALTEARQYRALERAHAEMSAEQRRGGLVAALQRTLSPVIAELHRGLSLVAPALTDGSVAAMSDRLSTVAYDAARVVPAVPEANDQQLPPAPGRAPLSAALDFPQDRPLFAATLTGLALLPLVVPDALRARGPEFALHVLAGVAAIVIALTISLIIIGRVRLTLGKPPEMAFVAVFLIPGILGSVVLALLAGWPPPASYLPLIVILPFGGLFCGANVSAAVGLAYSNQDLADRVTAIHMEATRLANESAEADARARKQLDELLHGPVYGRLSACAMALNFHAEELARGDRSRSDHITTTVLDYLSAASDELDALAST